jgi:YGGT family
MSGSILSLLATLIQIYSLVLLARVILSWVPNVNPMNPIVNVLYGLTEPVLEPVRRALSPEPRGATDAQPASNTTRANGGTWDAGAADRPLATGGTCRIEAGQRVHAGCLSPCFQKFIQTASVICRFVFPAAALLSMAKSSRRQPASS